MTVLFNGLKRKHTMDVVEALAGHKAGRLVLVDVREDSERARGFAPGSRHLPLRELKQRFGELPTDRPVAFICQSGRRSAMAATATRRAGLDANNVTAARLPGSNRAWTRQLPGGPDDFPPAHAR